MSASGFPVHGQPCISCILKNWMSPKLQRIPTENKQLSELYLLILYIISQISTKINRNLTNGMKNGIKCISRRYFSAFLCIIVYNFKQKMSMFFRTSGQNLQMSGKKVEIYMFRIYFVILFLLNLYFYIVLVIKYPLLKHISKAL